MKDASPKTIFLQDYRQPDFLIEKTQLTFELAETVTQVTAELSIARNKNVPQQAPLILDGQDMVLQSIAINGRALSAQEYQQDEEQLSIASVPDTFTLTTTTLLEPQKNTSLEGLYKSGSMFCTQCEAEGFRKITYYLDRPDVLSEFTTTVIADKDRYPVLLSNGNAVAAGDGDDGRHWVTWHDPFKKPAYLFALVAGNLVSVDDEFTTVSGRKITLRIFVEEKDVDKCAHAMDSLKRAMRWDEQVYGREYDLDIFMIVAVDDFNMGAMENKGLNIFNTSCVLARPETTTDTGFQRVEGVVAHEYFHNWSGNRVTCRDWFQLSLKEGFTVFRDAEFSAAMGSPTVKRVEDVSLLRTLQFAEDAGPMAHPVQPSSFIEISNFYTLTVYEKGAEVVRMIHTLLGAGDFRRGSDLYFERHDGQAVTIDNFVKTMEDASGRDLTQFKYWYTQAGTPELRAEGRYDEQQRTFTLTVRQSCPSTPEASAEQKKPFHIPLAMGLLGEAGALPVKLQGEMADGETGDNTHRVLELTEKEHTFVFIDLPEAPVPSLLRGFSAPVKLFYDYSRNDLLRLMSGDDDGFCRWDASQQLGVSVIREIMDAASNGKSINVDSQYIDGFRRILTDESLDPAMVALMLELPSEAYIGEFFEVVEVDAIHQSRDRVRLAMASALRDVLLQAYRRSCDDGEFSVTALAVAKRSLKNTALTYLMLLDDREVQRLCVDQFESAGNMTDVFAALKALVNCEHDPVEGTKQEALDNFFATWRHEPLVVNQWLAVQASCRLPGTLERVKALMKHPIFDIKNPNKVRSLIGAFANQNPANFHRLDGAGYEFLATQILKLNGKNPQVAARLVTPLSRWRRYDSSRQALMKEQLQRVIDASNLSKDVYEVVSKSLS